MSLLLRTAKSFFVCSFPLPIKHSLKYTLTCFFIEINYWFRLRYSKAGRDSSLPANSTSLKTNTTALHSQYKIRCQLIKASRNFHLLANAVEYKQKLININFNSYYSLHPLSATLFSKHLKGFSFHLLHLLTYHEPPFGPTC